MPKGVDYDKATIEKAKDYWLRGFSFRAIAKQMDIFYLTIFTWHKKYQWVKEKPDYPVTALKTQLARYTGFIEKLEPELIKIDILAPTKEQKQILANYKAFTSIQLKLINQLGVLKPTVENPSKKSIFID